MKFWISLWRAADRYTKPFNWMWNSTFEKWFKGMVSLPAVPYSMNEYIEVINYCKLLAHWLRSKLSLQLNYYNFRAHKLRKWFDLFVSRRWMKNCFTAFGLCANRQSVLIVGTAWAKHHQDLRELHLEKTISLLSFHLWNANFEKKNCYIQWK